MLNKFVEELYSSKAASKAKDPSVIERDFAVKRREHSRSDSGGKRNSFFSLKADGLLFLPGDHVHIPLNKSISEGSESTASRRSSMSFADSRTSSERSESRASSLKGRKLVRLSRKPGQAKPTNATQSTDGQAVASSQLVRDSSESPEPNGVAGENAPQRKSNIDVQISLRQS